jgi:hypothetical protein
MWLSYAGLRADLDYLCASFCGDYMFKIAIRLSVLVAVMVIAVVFFIWYRSGQPPALLGLVPKEVEKLAYIDTRNVVKKWFKHTSASDSAYLNLRDVIPFPLSGFFSLASSARILGINLYSELVWFETSDSIWTVFVKLSSPDKWEEFLQSIQSSALLKDVEAWEDMKYTFSDSFGLSIAWRHKHLALSFYPGQKEERVPRLRMGQLLKPEQYHALPTAIHQKSPADLFYWDGRSGHTFVVLPGKIRFAIIENKGMDDDLWRSYSSDLQGFDTVYADTSGIWRGEDTRKNYPFNPSYTPIWVADVRNGVVPKQGIEGVTIPNHPPRTVLFNGKHRQSKGAITAGTAYVDPSHFPAWDLLFYALEFLCVTLPETPPESVVY